MRLAVAWHRFHNWILSSNDSHFFTTTALCCRWVTWNRRSIDHWKTELWKVFQTFSKILFQCTRARIFAQLLDCVANETNFDSIFVNKTVKSLVRWDKNDLMNCFHKTLEKKAFRSYSQSQNLFQRNSEFQYRVKNWNNRKWPDDSMVIVSEGLNKLSMFVRD